MFDIDFSILFLCSYQSFVFIEMSNGVKFSADIPENTFQDA